MNRKLTKTEARQGVKGHNVRYVLLFSLLLAVIAMVAVYIFGS